MRRLARGLAAALAALVAVLIARAAALESTQLDVPALPPVALDEPAALERLRGGVRIPTISHEDGAERDAAAFAALHRHLAESFPLLHARLALERIADLTLLYRWAGTDPGRPALVLLAHQDVVPIDGDSGVGWSHPPFAAEVEDGQLYGRGSLDDKASLFAIAEAVESLLAAGFAPAADVYLAFGHDEELGGEGAAAVAARLAEYGVAVGLVLDEGGAIIAGQLPGVAAPLAAVGVAEKGYLSLSLEARSSGGHSAAPSPGTPIEVLARALLRIVERPLPSRLDPTVRAFFERGAGPESPFALKIVYANLWLFDPLVRAALDRIPGAGAMIRTTAAPTIFEAGEKDNVLPARARAVVNFRLLPGDSSDAVVGHVEELLADLDVELHPSSTVREPTAASRMDGPAWDALARSIREVFPGTIVAPYLMVAATDSRHFRGLSEGVYQFLPLELTPDDMRRAHGTDERIPVDDLPGAIRFYRRLIENAAGGGTAGGSPQG